MLVAGREEDFAASLEFPCRYPVFLWLYEVPRSYLPVAARGRHKKGRTLLLSEHQLPYVIPPIPTSDATQRTTRRFPMHAYSHQCALPIISPTLVERL
jgi:hypothetical protein